ncbi:hypothetical protein ACIQH7_05840 [Streptomyces anulatus]
MTTTPKGTTMPTDPAHRALLRAIDGLTTQVRRIADTLEPSVATDDDGAQTTGADAGVYSDLHSAAHSELDRIYTRRAPGGEGYVSLTIDEQVAMAAKLEKATAAIERVRTIKPSPPRSDFNARTNAQDEGWDQALATVMRVLFVGPITEDGT